MTTTVIYAVIGVIIGGGAGYFFRISQSKKETEGAEAKASKLIEDAKHKARDIELAAKNEALKATEESKKELKEKENKLARKEESIDQKIENLDKRYNEIDKERQKLEEIKDHVREIKAEQSVKLEKVAKLTKDEARKELFEIIEKENKEEVVKQIKLGQERAREEGDKEAAQIIVESLQKYASPVTTENVVTSVAIPSDEMKGRIIGREGRNIQVFEKITGVDVIIDDTPDAVTISCFDPVRREVGRMTLEKLIKDGRIHPGRIEELFEEAKRDVGKVIKEAGEQALYETGVSGINPDLTKVLGKLKFRTSYGQNVLRHSIETAYLAEIMATQLGLNSALAKKAGLLHDIGKALDHQIEGTHSSIGGEIGKKYNLEEEVLDAIEAHHNEVKQKTVYAPLIAAADAISSARPGARRETTETYIKRLQDLEAIANSFDGIDKSYAIQAGREMRIFVKPTEIDDLGSVKLAKAIASKIEKELKYPGEIKVTVIRETRAQEVAK